MSSKLPPYSTYRTDKTQCMVPQAVSHGNILTFTPRGFRQTLNVKFPDSRLAVCEKCKRNYKTRDSCRVRSGHTSEPWTTAFICVTVDDSCTDANGNYVDKPMTVRMVQWQPYCVKEDFEKKTPVCAACKKTNRTRSFCRVRHKHKQLPWCTVFVILSTVDSTDPSTVVAQPSIPVEYHENSIFAPHPPKPQKSFDGIPTDDINAIESSRTFLCKISCTHSSIHWLEYNDTEGGGPTNNERDVKALNEAIRTPGAGAPPPVMDANQQYYQMTQQAMQQQAFLHQHGHQHQHGHPLPPHGHVPHGHPSAPYGWYPPPPPPPSHMMPPMGAVMNPDGTATQTNPNMAAVPGAVDLNGNGNGNGVNPVNMDRKDQPDVKEDEDGNANANANGTSPAVDPNAAYQQQAWHAQMMYQQQLYQQQHQMYAQQPPQPQYGSPGGTGMESARGGPNDQGAQAQHTYGTYQDSAPAPVAQQNYTPDGNIAADHHQDHNQLHSAQQQQPQHQQQQQQQQQQHQPQQQAYQDHEQNAGQSLLQMQYPLPMQDPSQQELFSSPHRGGIEHLNGGDAVNGDDLPISTGNDIDVKVVDDKSNGNDNAISTDPFVPMFSNPSFQTNSGIGVDGGPIHGDDIQPSHTDGDFKKEDKNDTSVGLDVGGADPPVKRMRVDSPVRDNLDSLDLDSVQQI